MEGALGSFQPSGRENARGRYKRSCQVPVCLPVCLSLPFAPPFFLLHLCTPKAPRHTLLGLSEEEVTWLSEGSLPGLETGTSLKECYGGGSFRSLP